MAARPGWEGFLKFNLISVPIKAYNAAVSGGGKIGFHLLHKNCGSRIQYKKVCPVHGEVQNDEIVSGYEYSKGEYIVIDPDEIKKLRTINDKTIAIDTFIRPEDIDLIYFSGRTYYLIPEGKVAQKPYTVLQEVMAEQQRYGVGQVVFSGREQVAVIRPVGGLLVMSLLNFAEQIKAPATFEEGVPHVDVSPEERKLAETLIDSSTAEKFDLTRYKDQYESQLRQLIEAKAKGRKIIAARKGEEPAVINLMDALRQSLRQAQPGAVQKRKHNSTKEPRPGRKPGRPGRRKTG